jgi:hypothetical protein
MTDQDRILVSTAIHEAAHSIIAYRLGVMTRRIRICRQRTTDLTEFDATSAAKLNALLHSDELDSELTEFAHNAGIAAAAGYIAEARQTSVNYLQLRDTPQSPGSSDYEQMKLYCTKLKVESSSMIRQWESQAIQRVDEDILLICALAKALIDSPAHALTGKDVQHIISSHSCS